MAAKWEVDVSGVEDLQQKMEQFGAGSGQVIQEYLQSEGLKRIGPHITGLIHASGRKWSGKATSAASASYSRVFGSEQSGLTLTVTSKSKYHYLYFPDDGSTTRKHAGNQQFMRRGAEEAMPEMVDEMVDRLVAAFEES